MASKGIELPTTKEGVDQALDFWLSEMEICQKDKNIEKINELIPILDELIRRYNKLRNFH